MPRDVDGFSTLSAHLATLRRACTWSRQTASGAPSRASPFVSTEFSVDLKFRSPALTSVEKFRAFIVRNMQMLFSNTCGTGRLTCSPRPLQNQCSRCHAARYERPNRLHPRFPELLLLVQVYLAFFLLITRLVCLHSRSDFFPSVVHILALPRNILTLCVCRIPKRDSLH